MYFISLPIFTSINMYQTTHVFAFVSDLVHDLTCVNSQDYFSHDAEHYSAFLHWINSCHYKRDEDSERRLAWPGQNAIFVAGSPENIVSSVKRGGGRIVLRLNFGHGGLRKWLSIWFTKQKYLHGRTGNDLFQPLLIPLLQLKLNKQAQLVR